MERLHTPPSRFNEFHDILGRKALPAGPARAFTFLDALAEVDDPTKALCRLDKITRRRRLPSGRIVKPFNPIAKEERTIFCALMAGEHCLRGFSNKDLRERLLRMGVDLPSDPRKQSGKVSRLLARLHAYGLVAKVPRTRRWRVSAPGFRIMSAAIHIREVDIPALHDHPQTFTEAA